MKITRRFLLIFILVLIFPTLAIHQGVIRYTKHVMEENIIAQNERMAELIVNRLNSQINDVVLQLQLVAGVPDEKRLLQTVMYERAKQAISNSTLIHSIYYIDSDFNVAFEAPFHPEVSGVVYRYPKLDHVKWSLKYVVTDLVTNPRNERVVTVALPVFYSDRQFKGALVAELSQNYLSNILKSSSETRDGFSFLVDSEGMVIASTHESDWAKNYSSEPIVRRLMKGDSGSIQERNRGIPSVMTYQTMRENWGLALGVPEKVAFKPVKTLSRVLTYSYLGFFTLIICLILLGTRHLLLPILRLTQFARRFKGDGDAKELPASLITYRDEVGDLARTLTDMAARIERNHRFLQDIIEGIPYALITLDGNERISRVNSKWVDLVNVPAAECEGKRIRDLPELPLLSLDSKESELTWKDGKGVTRILKVVTAPFHDGVLAIVQDISQLKMWEAYAAQSERLALIGQINTGMAHELKNPLAVLSSSSELLIDEVKTDPSSEWVATLVGDIDDEIRRMTQIVNEFLSMARSKQEDVADVELERLLDRVLHLTRIKLNEQGIHAQREYHQPIATIQGKPNKLVQVFLNLFLNALESMQGDGTMVIRILLAEGEVWVEVEDEGKGISEENMQWIFNPFFSTKNNGNGLGLTIARDIMIEHGGSLEIFSKKQQGTVVRCRFPLPAKEDAA